MDELVWIAGDGEEDGRGRSRTRGNTKERLVISLEEEEEGDAEEEEERLELELPRRSPPERDRLSRYRRARLLLPVAFVVLAVSVGAPAVLEEGLITPAVEVVAPLSSNAAPAPGPRLLLRALGWVPELRMSATGIAVANGEMLISAAPVVGKSMSIIWNEQNKEITYLGQPRRMEEVVEQPLSRLPRTD